jgi:hypothetical protein
MLLNMASIGIGVGLPGEGRSYPALEISLEDIGGVPGVPSTTIDGISINEY